MVILLLFVLNTAHAARIVWYVHPDSALNSIQAALDSCADGDIVLVGPGTYYENILWSSTQGIHLISELGPDVTIIDGGSGGSVIWITPGIDSTTIINGFTIREGCGCLISGGIVCDFSSPTITNNTVTGNGDGITCQGGSPAITGNTINSNIACGIACWESSPTVTNNTITENSLDGVTCFFRSSPTIDSCTISRNDRDGVHCEPGSKPVINYNNITHNAEYGVRNADDTVIVNAEYNWWGDPTGPYHPNSNPGGLGDSVSDYVDFIPWLDQPVGVKEKPIVNSIKKHDGFTATIITGPLLLPEGKKCRVFDITGRIVVPEKISPGIYFIEVGGKITRKVVKIR